MLTALRVLWLLSIAAFGGVVAIVWASSIDGSEREADSYARELRHAPSLDARLDRDVMRTRAGHLDTYDHVVGDLAELKRLRARLLDAPRFLTAAARADLEQRVQGWAKALDEREELIEEFKKDDAVLKNSVRFLPEGATELDQRLRLEPGGSSLAADIDELARLVLRYNVLPEADAGRRAQARVGAFQAGGDRDADVLRTHAQIILDHKKRVDDTIEAITKLPMAALGEAMDDAYSRQYQSILVKSTRRKIALLLVGIAVVALGAADGLLRMKRAAAAQQELTDQLQRANVALRREQEREKELNDLKNRFVSMASHEFRTPLSVILSSTELLETYWERWPTGKKREHFVRIQSAMKTITVLLDQILVIGRADAGKLDFNPTPLDVAAFCQELSDAMRQTTGGDRNIELRVPSGLGRLELDDNLLGHILMNLLGNAIKYSHRESTVWFEVAAQNDAVTFKVRDAGIGIPQEDLPNLFESFYRGGNVDDIKGTGLGLAVAKRSAERHGGTIYVTSEVGVGTEFVVTLPTRGARA